MHIRVLLLLAFSFQYSSLLSDGFSLSVDKSQDVIFSPNAVFSAGFYAVGENAYVFAIWFIQPPRNSQNPTVVCMANSNQPVNGKRSSLTLHHTGNLILSDAGQLEVWSTDTESSSPAELRLNNNGNLVLYELREKTNNIILWQSFGFPTDTLLPGQPLTRYTRLVSARTDTNHSSGFYKLFFDGDNVLRLLYDGPEVSSVYWPDPGSVSFQVGRTTYNSSRVAVLDSLGVFNSSDNYRFTTSDYGVEMQRRLKIDPDGNVRVYSRQRMGENEWYVSWQAISDSCKVHGICGANSTCKYDTKEGRKCSCLPGYRVKNHSDWSYGCEPKFETLSCHINNSTFLKLPDVELYGYDYALKKNISYKNCVDSCLRDCECRAFQYTFRFDSGFFKCYTKGVLFNGRRSPSFEGVTYLRLPINNTFFSQEESAIENGHVCSVKLERAYAKKHESNFVKFFLWLSVAIGVFEILCVFLTWCFLFRTKRNSDLNRQGYNTLAAPGCRKFTYSELKQATKRFSEEIGRGAGGIVYKGVLSDQRIPAIKKLYNTNDDINESKQGEGEFLAEVSIIGRLNHMNLIQMWGYCAEGKQRLLVYEYMENGSLAENLNSNTLDWSKRYNIALGTARVLAYLHEECLEWILHCDIKPQNILLDSNYEPKVADFGLSKLLNRNNDGNTGSFSMIRGTRGYMAPEWVFNLPITSKVDVYSYGIVVLEMITGRSATTGVQNVGGEEAESCGRLVTWVREKRDKTTGGGVSFWVEQIVDPAIELKDEFEARKVETLARVASECVEDDKDARPTMSQVVEMLQSQENDES